MYRDTHTHIYLHPIGSVSIESPDEYIQKMPLPSLSLPVFSEHPKMWIRNT